MSSPNLMKCFNLLNMFLSLKNSNSVEFWAREIKDINGEKIKRVLKGYRLYFYYNKFQGFS